MAIRSDLTRLSELGRAPVREVPAPTEAATRLDVLAMANAQGVVTFVSQAIAPQLGVAPGEILGRHVRALVHPADRDGVRRQLVAARRAPGKSVGAEYRLLCKDGDWRWCESTATQVPALPGAEAFIFSFRDAITRQGTVPSSERDLGTSEHFVQFYETDSFLIECLSAYCGAGLRGGDGCLVVATPEHLAGVERRLAASGLDVNAARQRNAYVALDAAECLSRFMLDGMPDPTRFAEVIGGAIAQAAAGERTVRVFGEMVALLWAQGAKSAAIRLEELWNELHGAGCRFSLMCAYPMHAFAGEPFAVRFADICACHTRVYPDETFARLASPDEQLLAITLLQQKASSLEAEIAERRTAELRLRVLAESVPEKIFAVEPGGALDYVNPRWTEFTGLSFEELRDGGWQQIVHPADAAETARRWQRSLTTDEPFDCEQRLRGADGRYRWHVSRALPVRDDAGTITLWIGSCTDIDEQKQLEERKNAFISMASHELKTPVTSLKSFTQIVQRRLQRQQGTDAQTLLFLGRMETQLDQLTSLIGDLLDLSNMQTGTLPLRKTAFAVDDLVRETVENVQAAAPTHHFCLEGETRAQLYADRDRLGQVLINLLTNAVKYSPEADTVYVTMCLKDDQVTVAVRDFGPGIAEEHRGRIFERFYQVASPGGTAHSGLGIGLHIARTLVELHDGRLWLDSQPGSGSIFSFMVPLAHGEQA